jgi:hypothetical protein
MDCKFEVCFTTSLCVVPTVSYYPTLSEAAAAVRDRLTIGGADLASVYYVPTRGLLGMWRRKWDGTRNSIEHVGLAEVVAA